MEILDWELKVEANSRHYSTNLLLFLNSYLQKTLGSPPTYYQFANVKRTFHYLADLRRAIRSRRVSYQSHTYSLYWQTLNCLVQNIDHLVGDVQWKLHNSQFLEIMLA
jgi:hypothetical protein